MAMTLQGSVLSNGNAATNRVPLTLESSSKDSADVYLNEASNGFGDCVKNGLNSAEPIEEVKETPSDEPVIDITINNVVCSFSVKSHLNLKQIAQNGYNVEYRRENGVYLLKIFICLLLLIVYIYIFADGNNEITETLHHSLNLVFRESNLHRGDKWGWGQAGGQANHAFCL